MLEAGASIYLAQRLLCCQFLSSRPTTRDPAERETECEWRDPENACTTGLIQGVSTRTLSPKCAGTVGTQRGENASYRHGGGRTVGISRLRPQSPAPRDPSVSARNDRFAMHESGILVLIANGH